MASNALGFDLSDEDKDKLNTYLDSGVDYDKQAKQQALQKFTDNGMKDDPTLQNMTSGIAMGGVGGIENAAVKEAAPYAEQAGKAIIDEASPAFEKLKGLMQGSSPNASSATADAIQAQKGIVNNLAETLGYSHPKVQQAQAVLNRMSGR